MDSIRLIALRQPETMWVNQLTKDTDAVAQLEAVEALKITPHSFQAVEALNKVLCDMHCFYRVRMHAALALAKVFLLKVNNV